MTAADPDGGDALAEASEALRPRLVRVAYATVGSVAEAEDCVQEAWLRLLRAGNPAAGSLPSAGGLPSAAAPAGPAPGGHAPVDAAARRGAPPGQVCSPARIG